MKKAISRAKKLAHDDYITIMEMVKETPLIDVLYGLIIGFLFIFSMIMYLFFIY